MHGWTEVHGHSIDQSGGSFTRSLTGRAYLQSVVDAFCSLAFGKRYLSKLPMTAVDALNDRVLPFTEDRGVSVEHVLTDSGWEFCGWSLHHPYELFLAIHQIDHRNTKVHAP